MPAFHSLNEFQRQRTYCTLFRAFCATLLVLLTVTGCTNWNFPTASEIKSEDIASKSAQLLRVGEATAEGGDLASALNLFQRAASTRPDWAPAHLKVGETALALGQASVAASAYETAFDLTPEDAQAGLGLGKALITLDDPTKAEQTFRRVLELEPDNPSAFNGLGVALDMQSKHDAAQAQYREGLKRDPENLSLHNNYGLSLALMGAFDDAIRVLGQAATDPAAGPRSRQNLALAFGLKGDDERARQMGLIDLPPQQVESNLKRYAELRALSENARARAVYTGK